MKQLLKQMAEVDFEAILIAILFILLGVLGVIAIGLVAYLVYMLFEPLTILESWGVLCGLGLFALLIWIFAAKVKDKL